jgi:dTDP-4-dehydrorhamnose reductase
MYRPRSRDTAHAACAPRNARKILIAGAAGTLGQAFRRISEARGLPTVALTRAEFDITQSESVERVLRQIKPWAVINAAGYVRVDDAECDSANCYRVNMDGALELAAACARLGIQLATFSSDLVFDGRKGEPYVESDRPSPLSVYGSSKAKLEQHLGDIPNALVIRTSAFFGPWDEYNFLSTTLGDLGRGRAVVAANDAIMSPTYIPDLVDTTLDLIIDGECGIWHLANDSAVTWYEFATSAAARAGLDASLIAGKPMAQMGRRAKRPLNSALTSERGKLMPDLDDAMDRWWKAVGTSLMQPKEVEISSSV